MQIVLLGAPGAGKGTQAKLLGERLAIAHVSSGDLLRDAVKRQSDLGREAKRFMDSGELVPDDIVVGIIAERLEQPDCGAGFILDGFPRTISQAQTLDAMLDKRTSPIDVVVSVAVPPDVVVRRLSGRRTCSQCGALYHVDFDPPKTSGICDRCGAALFQRDDDKAETIQARLAVYDRQTAPLLDWYRSTGRLAEVDGQGDRSGVFAQICTAVEVRA